MITEIVFSKKGGYAGISFVGFKDKAFRDSKWTPEETDYTIIYADQIRIEGQDFIDNVLPKINESGLAEYAYNLLKERVEYLKTSIDV